jgi:hypothetical protein
MGHPSGPGIVYILRPNFYPYRQGEDGVHEEQEARIPIGQGFLRYLVADALRYVGDVVHSSALTKTAT